MPMKSATRLEVAMSAGELLLGPLEPHHLQLLAADVPDLLLALLGVLPQREGDVVVDIHGAEQGAVLEQHAELPAHLVELLLVQGGDVLVADPDLASVRLQQPDEVLEEDGLPGSGGAEQQGYVAFGHVEGDVFEDGLRAERLRQSADADLCFRHSFSHPVERASTASAL
jgi:hypothetical protein